MLCYSPGARLRPFFGYLAEIGFENPSRLVLARPSLLGLEVERSLQRMVEYLQAQVNYHNIPISLEEEIKSRFYLSVVLSSDS